MAQLLFEAGAIHISRQQPFILAGAGQAPSMSIAGFSSAAGGAASDHRVSAGYLSAAFPPMHSMRSRAPRRRASRSPPARGSNAT